MSLFWKVFGTAKASKLLSSKQRSCLSLLSLLILLVFLYQMSDSFQKKKMEQEYERKLGKIVNLRLFENALNINALQEYKPLNKCYHQIWAYVQNRDEFIRNLRNCYPSMTDSEVFNFNRIYLKSSIDENNCDASEFVFNDGTQISRICFMGPYLKEGDYIFFILDE